MNTTMRPMTDEEWRAGEGDRRAAALAAIAAMTRQDLATWLGVVNGLEAETPGTQTWLIGAIEGALTAAAREAEEDAIASEERYFEMIGRSAGDWGYNDDAPDPDEWLNDDGED